MWSARESVCVAVSSRGGVGWVGIMRGAWAPLAVSAWPAWDVCRRLLHRPPVVAKSGPTSEKGRRVVSLAFWWEEEGEEEEEEEEEEVGAEGEEGGEEEGEEGE
jgi:hypothetical protein